MLSLWFAVLIGGAIALPGRQHKRSPAPGPLYDYVHLNDGHFSWTEYDSTVQTGYTTYYLNMTSQRWYDESLSSRPVWWHYVAVHVPDVLRYPDSGFLFVGGGSNNNPPPDFGNNHLRRMGEFAAATGIVAAVVFQVPNQPIIFENDGTPRTEDDLIAWTWKRFYDEQHVGIDNPEVLARMPMCKASVKAMDAMQQLVKEKRNVDIEQFMIAGESKRGWTTWLTAAVDSRVIACAPVVLSCVNMFPNFHHYWRNLGGWSFAMGDYWIKGIMGLIDEPEMLEMAKIIDPYYYREYLTMPKMMISGASDEFFMPDDYDYFLSDLLGPKHIWILENSGHGLANGPLGNEYWKMLETFYLTVLEDFPRPAMDWTKQYTETGGSIILLSQEQPLTISAWSAPSIVPNRRDWRTTYLDGIRPISSNITWVESPVQNLGNGYYRAEFNNPETGYFAFFIKVTYMGPGGRTLFFSTDTAVLPNNFPYEDCEGAGCFGRLL
jgi:PhoPQ-activated pathogenicity-related protein